MTIRIAQFNQKVNEDKVVNIADFIRDGLDNLPLSDWVKPGMRIAIGVGSRNISSQIEVLHALVDKLKSLGAQPFFVTAMGSHGRSTGEGQKQVIESYGIRSDDFGIPIISSIEVKQIGSTSSGMPVFCDAQAAEADGIIVVNRIKEHTAFKARWESGLLKMLAVGLGNPRGATEIHNWGIPAAILPAARVVIEKLPIICGIGIVENGFHQAAKIAVLPADQIEEMEPGLLDYARSLLPHIPFEPLDLLVLQEIGKDISGTGMDLNVVGMWRRTGGPVSPLIKVLGALDLTKDSHGNAIGVGHADLVVRRLVEKIDWEATRCNCFTSKNYAGGKTPMTLETDKDLFDTALSGIADDKVRIVIAKNTLVLDTFWISESLLSDATNNPSLNQKSSFYPLNFDSSGTLLLPNPQN